MQPDITEKLKSFIQPIIDQEEAELVDLVYRRESGSNVLRLLVDKPGGISLDDLSRINNNISRLMDKSALIEQSFVLEVNSPGLDRPLITRRDYERKAGKRVKLIIRNEKGATDIVAGDIKGSAEDRVILDINGAESMFLFRDIIKAKLEIHY